VFLYIGKTLQEKEGDEEISMGCIKYHKEQFIIFNAEGGIVVYNTDKDFDKGHTHLKSFKAGKDAINFVLMQKIPSRASNYYLRSLIRLSTNSHYIGKIEDLIKVRKQKGKKLSCRKRKLFNK